MTPAKAKSETSPPLDQVADRFVRRAGAGKCVLSTLRQSIILRIERAVCGLGMAGSDHIGPEIAWVTGIRLCSPASCRETERDMICVPFYAE